MMKRKLQGAMQQLDERLKGQYASLSPAGAAGGGFHL